MRSLNVNKKISSKAYFSLAFLSLLIVPFQNCGQFEVIDLQPQPSIVNSSGFQEAQKILTDNCIGCHNASSPTGSVAHSSEAGFVQSGWIMPQNPSASKLITRLKNYPFNDGSQNMPSGTATLSQADYQTLYNWVQNIAANTGNLNCSINESVHQAAVKRLTKNQLINSLNNAFGNIFVASDYPDMRDDNPRIGFADNPNLLEINEINLESLLNSSEILVTKIISNTPAIQNCIGQASGTNCFGPIVAQYGQALWRRPVASQEQTALNTEINTIAQSGMSRAAQMQFVLKALILSPNHLFRTEIGGGPANGIFNLTHYEVASFLSFAAWDSPPDATLMTLASQNRLHDVAVLRQQVDRLAADPRYNQKLSQFIVDLLKIEDVKTIQKDASFNLTSAERNALYDSALLSIQQSYDSTNADLLAPFSMGQYHLNSQTNRFIAGASGGQLAPMSVNPNERYGVLSHPAFLTSMSGQISSGIVRRGVFTLEQLLCEHLPPAPADVTPDPNLPPGFDPATASSRDILTVTHSSQAACIGCHVKIDPPGFAFESFDAIGRFRTTERGSIPIDASGTLRGIDANPIIFSNSVGFLRELQQSPRFKSCMNEKFFEYITGFAESNSAQNCEKENFQRNLSEKPETKHSLLESLIELPSFTRRRPATNSR